MDKKHPLHHGSLIEICLNNNSPVKSEYQLVVDKDYENCDQENLASLSSNNYGPKEPRRILKNLIVLGISFVLIFTAFMATANLQSTLHGKGGLGPYSLASIYLGLVISSLFLPSLMMKKLKCKLTIFLSISGYLIFILVQFYPAFYTLIPAGFFLGITAAPLWAAQSTYVSRIGEEYAKLTNAKSETVLQQFFGIFFLLVQSAYIWGNLILSLILNSGIENESELKSGLKLACGANYCPVSEQEHFQHPELSSSNRTVSEVDFESDPINVKIRMLIGIYGSSVLAGAFVLAIFVDSLKRYGEDDKSAQSTSTINLLLATFNQMRNPNQLLLIPLSLWFGISIGFYGTDFTVGFVSCAWGVKNLGYVMIVYGIMAALSSFFLGKLIQYTGRIPLFLVVAGVNLIAILILLFWVPNPEEFYVFFIVAGLWGLVEGFWQPQISALYGSLFPNNKEAAFSNIRLWQSLGFMIAYINGTKFCMRSKLYFGIVMILISVIGYLLVEFRVGKLSKNTSTTIKKSST